MKQRMVWWMVRVLLLVALALPVGTVSAIEGGALLEAIGTATVEQSGQRIASLAQGETLTLVGSNFRFDELIGVWVTFPDGRVVGLDNEDVRANKAGEFRIEYRLDGRFATGLHRFSARGKVSGRGAIVPVMLRGGGGAPATEGTVLRFIPTVARQNGSVEMYGSGFTPRENVSLWLTRPDGIVVGLGYVRACQEGRLAMDLILPATLPIGQYNVSARGNTSGRVTTSQVTVLSGADPSAPGPDFTANIGTVQQRTLIELRGEGFRPNESISFWLTKPNGAIQGLDEQRADRRGNLSTTIFLSEALPVGTHFISFRSNTSGLIGFVEVYLAPGPQDPGQE